MILANTVVLYIALWLATSYYDVLITYFNIADLNVTPKHSDAHHCGDQEIGPTIGKTSNAFIGASVSVPHTVSLSILPI